MYSSVVSDQSFKSNLTGRIYETQTRLTNTRVAGQKNGSRIEKNGSRVEENRSRVGKNGSRVENNGRWSKKTGRRKNTGKDWVAGRKMRVKKTAVCAFKISSQFVLKGSVC